MAGFIRNLSGKERTLVYIAMMLGAVAVIYNMAISPIITHRRALGQEVRAKTTVLKRNVKLLGMYKPLEEKYIKYDDLIEISASEEEELSEALSVIENLSKKDSCYIANIKPLAAKKVGNYKEISFDVTVEGNIDNFARFLYDLETSRENLRVRHFTITPISGVSADLRIALRVSKIIII